MKRCKCCKKEILEEFKYCVDCARCLRKCMLCGKSLPENAHGLSCRCPKQTGRDCIEKVIRIKAKDRTKKYRDRNMKDESKWRKHSKVLTTILMYFFTPKQLDYTIKITNEAIEKNNFKLLDSFMSKKQKKGWSNVSKSNKSK